MIGMADEIKTDFSRKKIGRISELTFCCCCYFFSIDTIMTSVKPMILNTRTNVVF